MIGPLYSRPNAASQQRQQVRWRNREALRLSPSVVGWRCTAPWLIHFWSTLGSAPYSCSHERCCFHADPADPAALLSSPHSCSLPNRTTSTSLAGPHAIVATVGVVRPAKCTISFVAPAATVANVSVAIKPGHPRCLKWSEFEVEINALTCSISVPCSTNSAVDSWCLQIRSRTSVVCFCSSLLFWSSPTIWCSVLMVGLLELTLLMWM